MISLESSAQQKADAKVTDIGPQLCLIVPTLNEANNITTLLSRLNEALTGIDWEAIFVDDDSPDSTAALIRSIANKIAESALFSELGVEVSPRR